MNDSNDDRRVIDAMCRVDVAYSQYQDALRRLTAILERLPKRKNVETDAKCNTPNK